MRLRVASVLSFVSLLAVIASPLSARATSFSNTADFSASSNPNGPWGYGWESTLGGTFTAYTTPYTSAGLDGWTSVSGGNVEQNNTSSTITAASATWYPGEMSLHPSGTGNLSVVRFTVPATSLYDVSAWFYGVDAHPTTTDVHVLINGVSVFDAFVNSYRGVGQTYTTTGWSLAAGDTLDLAVGWGANLNYGWDSTGLSATITQVPEPGTLALISFGLLGLGTRTRRSERRA
jgi:hypothetical protein